MAQILVPTITPRPYQKAALDWWADRRGEPSKAVEVWARRGGKDLTYANIAHMKATQERKGLYLHFLPEFAHARRTLWDGFTNDGTRFVDAVFPPETRKAVNDHEMRVELRNGAVWQLGGSDQYDRWVGGNPIWCCFSEYALANPRAWDIMRPILQNNGGSAAFISTPRGYNHLHTQLEIAKRGGPSWRHTVLTAFDMGTMTEAQYQQEIDDGMPEELARQEYRCDFAAANVGSILGRGIERAERDGRILTPVWDMGGADIIISSDIGFRDTAAWWFWQPCRGGFNLVDYDEDNGLDAEEWLARLALKPWRIETVWLPHDARAKTFQSRHSVVEKFAAFYGGNRVRVAPAMKSQDKVNAGRTVLARVRIDSVTCAQGLLALRDWSYKWDPDRKTYSKEPDHNWASHGADAFCYGAAMLRDYVSTQPAPERQLYGAHETFTLDQLFADREGRSKHRRLP